MVLNTAKYPDIKVRVVGKKPFQVVNAAAAAMRAANVDVADIEAFGVEVMAAPHEDLLQICLKWVTLE